MYSLLNRGLHSTNGFVRKGSAFLLKTQKGFVLRRVHADEFLQRPPVLANSFPKSGTHLLDQIAEGLPDRVNYGAFLGSHISSFQFRLRSAESTRQYIASFVPGEIVRGHLFFSDAAAQQLAEKNTVHYFIYRDPRDVVLSEAHYLRSINRWHRLHHFFRDAATLEDAISLAIVGLSASQPGLDYSHVAERFASYAGWLGRDDVCCLRFEDLASADREQHLRRMIDFYAAHTSLALDVDAVVRRMVESMAPERSHTFRAGKSGGWRERFTPQHREQFKAVAGRQLIELGYEQDENW